MSSTTANPAARARTPTLLAILLTLVAGVWLGRLVLTSDWVMDADEAVHAIEALRCYDRLEHGEPGRFGVDVYMPERWQPPVQDHVRWYGVVHLLSVLPSFALLGPGDGAARLPSVLYLLGTCAVFFALARRLAPRAPEWSGLVAVFLLLSSPNVITFTPQALTELCVLFWCHLALYAYVRFVEEPTQRVRALLAGGALGLAILSKYDHGLLLMACLGVAELIRARLNIRALLGSNVVWLFGVPVLSFALWLAHPAKLQAFQDALAHPAYGTWRVIGANFVASWLFEYTASLGALLLLGIAFVACIPRLRDPRVRGVWLYAGLSTLLLVTRARFQFRYNLVEVPTFFLLAAIFLPEWIHGLGRRLAARRKRPLGAGLALSAAGLGLLAALAATKRGGDGLRQGFERVFAHLMSLSESRFNLTKAPADYALDLQETAVRALRLVDVSVLSAGAALFGLGLWLLLSRGGERAQRSALIVALSLATVPGSVAFWRRAEAMVRWEWEGTPELHAVLQEVAAHSPARGRILLGGGWDQLTNNTLKWSLQTRYLEPRPRYDDLEVVGDMIGSLVLPEEQRIEQWAEVLRSAPRSELPERVVLLEMRSDFSYREELGPEVPLYRAILEQRPAYDPIVRRSFDALGLDLEIWTRREAEVPPLVAPQGAADRTPVQPTREFTDGPGTAGDKAWRHLASPWLS